MAKKEITLGVSTLTSAVEEIEALNSTIAAASQDVAAGVDLAKMALLTHWTEGAAVAQYALDLRAEADRIIGELDQWADELATGYTASARASLEGLVQRQNDLVNQARALQTVLVETLKISEAAGVSIPGEASAKSTKKSSSSKGVKVSNVRYYRVRDGVKEDVADSQNKWSSISWYYSANIPEDRTPGVTRVPRANGAMGLSPDDLRSWLVKQNGFDAATESKGWEVEFAPGLKIGMRPVEAS